MPSLHNREEALFRAAVQLADAERAEFLNGACLGENALRQRLEALLAAHDQPDNLVPTQAETPRPTMNLDLADAPDESVGQTLGRYKLLERVGEGGCGVVYVAEQTDPVRRLVALKVIKLGMDTKQVVARFETERQALAMMDHPNIAKVLDAGTTDVGRPFFVMELVRGIRITDYCDQANLSTKERLDLFIKVCQAIQHAHQKGIIHRDIKPSNILVTLHDGVPVPKVIDFGIAKATEGRLTDATVYTQLHQFIGTPAYMSPEQAEMSGLDIDTRSDIYSLGVLLYELLAGSTPFDGQELMASGIDAMRKTIREKEPVRPSTKLSQTLVAGDVRRLKPPASDTPSSDEQVRASSRRLLQVKETITLLQGDLDWIVMKALEKDRSRRYETANGLAADIRRHLTNEPVVARPPSAAYKFQKAFRRNNLAFSAAAAVMAALALGVVVSAWQAARATQARRDAEVISTFLTEVFQSPDPSRDGRTITVAETLDRAVQMLESKLSNQPLSKARLEFTLGQTYKSLGLVPQSIPLLERALDGIMASVGAEDRDTLVATESLALALNAAGPRNEALKLEEQALLLSRKVLGPEHPDTIASMVNLASILNSAERREEALKMAEAAVSQSRKINGPEHPVTLDSMANLAIALEKVGRRDEALKLREELLSLNRKIHGPEHPHNLANMANLANSLFAAGRQEEALKLREAMLHLSRKVNGSEHPQTLVAMANLAKSLFAAGRQDEALKLREAVLPLSRKVNDPEHPDTLTAMALLADSMFDAGRHQEAFMLRQQVLPLVRKHSGANRDAVFKALGQLAESCEATERGSEAIKLYEEMLPIQRELHDTKPQHHNTAALMIQLTQAYQLVGRSTDAVKLGQESLAFCREKLGPENRGTVSAIVILANSYGALNRNDEKVKLLEAALPLSRQAYGPNSPNTVEIMNNLAAGYAKQGRWDDALKLQESALPLLRRVNGPEHPDTLGALQNLTTYYEKTGRRIEAIKVSEEIQAIRRKVGVELLDRAESQQPATNSTRTLKP